MKYTIINTNVPVLGVFNNTLKQDEKAGHIIRFLGLLLPTFLKLFHNVEYQESMFQTITKKLYQDLLDNFLGVLKEFKATSYIAGIEKAIKGGAKIKVKKDLYEALITVLTNATNKQKLKSNLENTSFLDIYKLVDVFSAESLEDKQWKNISDISRQIDDAVLKKYIKSVDGLGSDSSLSSLKDAQKEFDTIAKKLFKTTNPTDEQVSKLKDEKLKEYRAIRQNLKRKSKEALEDLWEEENLPEIADVILVRPLLKQLKITDPVDKGFVGKLKLSDSPIVLFNYYTIYDKELNSVPGSSVEMNKKYTKEDKTFYCTGYPQYSNSGRTIPFYTKELCRRNLLEKHEKIKSVTPKLMASIRSKCEGDYSIIINDHKLTSTSLAALVVAIIDDTCGRIGSKSKVEKYGTYGISVLIGKQCTFLEDGSVRLKYNGKKNVGQEHIITDPLIVEALRYLKSIRKANEYLFSKDGKTPVSAGYANKYIQNAGFPMPVHGVRKYYANVIFTQEINKAKKAKNFDPIKAFDSAISTVALKLGHEEASSISSYVNPELMNNYFKEVGVKPPKRVQNVIDALVDDDE